MIKNKEYLRSIIFGIEDSLVSTTGLVAGISIGAEDKGIVILAGIVAVSIEAVSMGVGEYLSDDAMKDFDKLKRKSSNPLLNGLFMFSSYLLAGSIPLAPVIFTAFPTSLLLAITFSLFSLFMLGYIKGRIVRTSPFRGGMKILIVGGIATILGIVIGLAFKM